MDEKLSNLRIQIEKINSLTNVDPWGPEFQLWEKTTDNLVKEIFGEEGSLLFKQQKTISFSYSDSNYNKIQYRKELDKQKKIIEGLLAEKVEHFAEPTTNLLDEKEILKEIWRKEEALKENLLTTVEAQNLQIALIGHLNNTLSKDSLAGLRFRKLLAEKRYKTWWSNQEGYPSDQAWEKIEPFLELLEQYEAEKTIKRRLEIEGLFVESRSQGGDQHLLIGEKNGSGEKAHIIIGGKSGEIRTEDKRIEPTELATHIETILTLPNGKKIRTTREAINEISN